MKSLTTLIGELRHYFEDGLQAEVNDWEIWPETLRDVSVYGAFSGGKRIRPILSFLVARAMGRDLEPVLPWAIAVELIHTYSLIHDDLPAMDDDDLRRGQPTCHIKFGEAPAILAGDALLTQAFLVIAQGCDESSVVQRLVQLLGEAAGGQGMVGGQALDISGSLKGLEQVRAMQKLKTGALIAASAVGPAIIYGEGTDFQQRLSRFGHLIGALFQVTDDLLDLDQDDQDDGKNLAQHLTLTEVKTLRDKIASDACASVAELFPETSVLLDFVEYIRARSV